MLTIPILFMILFAKGQQPDLLVTDLVRASNQNFKGMEADTIFKQYNGQLFWFNPNSKMSSSLKGETFNPYPLTYLKSEPAYIKALDILFADTAFRNQTLACLLVCAANDTSRRHQVEQILEKSNYTNYWAATTLTILKTHNIEPIVKCILNYEKSDGVSYLIADFLTLDLKLLDKFGMDSLSSSSPTIYFLAIKALALSPNSTLKEEKLKEAINTKDLAMKGWAIALLAQYRACGILKVIKPYLEVESLQEVALRALASSLDPNDINFLNTLIAERKIGKNLWKSLLYSRNEALISNWLEIFKNKEFTKDYYIDISNSLLMGNKKYFDQVILLIYNGNDELQTYALMNYFEGLKDIDTQEFLRKCLTHPYEGVREKARQMLEAINK